MEILTPGREKTMRVSRWMGLFCAIATAVASFALVPSSARAEEGGLRCQEMSFSVTLSPSNPQAYHVFGVLCSRGSLRHKTFQIALHGAAYSHLYWNWPSEPEIYSYVRRATAAGYAI